MSALISKHKLVAIANPDSPRTEMFRALRTNIQFADSDRERRVLAVTSSKPGEGKSTTVSNLAVLYAQAEKKVLLVDANLRKPALHRLFSASNRLGLTSVLSESCTIEHAVQELSVPNLSLMAAGPATVYPSEMLGSERMLKLLEELRTRYDLILIDASCLLNVTDSQVLSAFCDGVVFVVRAGKVRQKEAMQAMERLEHVRAKIVGVVLNRM
ncbi:CpsD/CapB family tyrosine-protein kinase [Cohnella candidum]|uniref:non-specific protein-tyrosine kinase n=1 Tax=Cohnella candidum TaxID=2674991 RepID=A0A3G3JZZ5_9BACL|nr:CpsD/CapB family tyrosine-protein kinase [Cohnella candidum]AYQ73820.1 polysaccharide biosynthesis tyrosine autokinase [Cohnella candidum]